MLPAVRRFIRRHQLLPRGARVAVAVSGGPDSVALLHALREIASDGEFVIAAVIHLNHQLRGADADADEVFCRELAARSSLPFDVERIDVRALAAERGQSIEHAAHDARVAYYERAAARLGVSSVAVGHTKDDQAETFLLRLLRGAGPRGLGGMHPSAGIVVRPLLDVTRAQVLDYLRAHAVSFREDASNADRDIARNRVRHELLPLLKARFSPAIVEVLDREAAIARDDEELLEKMTAEVSARVIGRRNGSVEISVPDLLALPPALARRVIRRAQQAAGGKFVGYQATDAVLALAVSNETGPIDLPGHRVNRRGDLLVLSRRDGRAAPDSPAEFSYALDVPGRVAVPEASCAIVAEALELAGSERSGLPLANRGNEVAVARDLIVTPFVVRSRRPGDEFRPLGLKGHKKLQDVFVDAKIARGERDRIPLVLDGNGRIIWVAGLGISEEFRVTAGTRAVVILKRESAVNSR